MASDTQHRIRVQCASCSSSFHVPAHAGGKRGKCPTCGAVVVVPPDAQRSDAPRPSGERPRAPETADRRDSIKFACTACSKSIRVPAAAAGRRAKCPACRAVVTVPAAAAADVPSEEPDGDLLSGLSAGTALAAPTIPAAAPVLVRAGSEAAPSGAAVAGQAKAIAGALGGILGEGSRFLLGCIASGVGAAIGVGVWFAIARSFGVEIGYIALGLGGLAGLGMFLGHREASQVGGLVAAGIALAGILLAKYLVFSLVIVPTVSDIVLGGDPREILVDYLTGTAVEKRNLPKYTNMKDLEQVYALEEEKAREEVAAMTDAQVQQRLDDVRVELESALTEQPSFLVAAFGLKSLLFTALAVAAAWKIGSLGMPGST